MTTLLPALGLFGGSFDPVHVAHLAVAQAAGERLVLEEIRFLPAGQPWQKPGLTTPAASRAAMLKAALAELAPSPWRLVVDEREMHRHGPSYTIDTLLELRAELGAALALVLIIGADQLQRLHTWHRWQELFDHAHLAVATRPGFDFAVLPAVVSQQWQRRLCTPAALRCTAAGRVCQLDGLDYDIAATVIRAGLKAARGSTQGAGTAITDLLPRAVLAYIEANQLYQD